MTNSTEFLYGVLVGVSFGIVALFAVLVAMVRLDRRRRR